MEYIHWILHYSPRFFLSINDIDEINLACFVFAAHAIVVLKIFVKRMAAKYILFLNILLSLNVWKSE